MWCFKCATGDKNKDRNVKIREENEEQVLVRNEEEQLQEQADEEFHIDEAEGKIIHGIKFVYFSSNTPSPEILNLLQTISKDAQTFTDESECIQYMKTLPIQSEFECSDYVNTIPKKIFLIIDGSLSSTFVEEMKQLPLIDSVFMYSSSPVDSIVLFNEKLSHSYVYYLCENIDILMDSIKKSREDVDKQTVAFVMYKRKGKSTRDLSKELGSYIFFRIMKHLIQNLPKMSQAKQSMITTLRNYYRGNPIVLGDIEDFDRTYRSSDAIRWFMKECFLPKFVNEVVCTEDIDVLYVFRYYLVDLSEEIQLKCLELRKKQKDLLKLYRGGRLNLKELMNYQNNIGNGISINEYLLTTSERSIAYNHANQIRIDEDNMRVLFEYEINLKSVENIVVGDVHEYSLHPEENQFLFDRGSVFEIDSCSYNTEEDLWHIQLHATDRFDNDVSDYMEYQKKKMAASNVALMLGNLLIEMGEYAKAERYFDTILSSSNPNDEEIACIFYNFGYVHRLKGDFNRAIGCYNRAYNLHMNAKPKRLGSAGKALNGLGVVYMEQGKILRAEECFKQALKCYKRSIPKYHTDNAALLINTGSIDCERKDYDQAIKKFLRGKKIYDRSLPAIHPHQALPRMNLGNVYLATNQYEQAREEYENALKLQQASLPHDHPDIARTLHNLVVLFQCQGKIELSKEYLERAEEIASRSVSMRHPLMIAINKTKTSLCEDINQSIERQVNT